MTDGWNVRWLAERGVVRNWAGALVVFGLATASCALPETELSETEQSERAPSETEFSELGQPEKGQDEALADVGPDPAVGTSSVEVVRLADGDSGWFRVDGEEVEVRLLGYNAPERYENDAATEPSCNGQNAERALTQLLQGAESIELQGSEIDRFGRTLADLDIDGVSAVSTLIDGGFGLALGDGPDRDLMKEAAAEGRGLWGDQCGRPMADGLVITRAEPNPPGPDEDDLNGEWVELFNDGDLTIDLTGWDIRDDSSSNRFRLGGRLQPGESLLVRTGTGRSGEGEYYLGSDSPVWSNRTDTVLAIDPAGTVAAWFFIDG